MMEISEIDGDTKYGHCSQCGRRIVLPCLACQVEALRKRSRAGRLASQEEVEVDLSICLDHPEQQRRYETVRTFRDEHGYPMWSAQWYAKLIGQFCPQT